MTKRTHGTPVVSANITFYTGTEESTVKTVLTGDTITDLVINTSDPLTADVTIPTCTVVGFTLKGLTVERGVTAVFDGIPTYNRDPNGSCFHGTVEEVYEIDKMIVSMLEEDVEVHKTVRVSDIKSMGDVTSAPVEDEEPDMGV